MANPTNELAEAVEALLLTLEGFVATCDGKEENGDPCLNFATFEVGSKLYCAEHARLVSDEEPLVETGFGVKVRRVRTLLGHLVALPDWSPALRGSAREKPLGARVAALPQLQLSEEAS